jgi:hypothetical protein
VKKSEILPSLRWEVASECIWSDYYWWCFVSQCKPIYIYICNSRHAWEAAWTTKNLSAKYISINVLLSVCKRQIHHIFAALNLFEIPRSLSFEYSVIFSGILWAICHGNASTKGALHAAWRLGFDAPATFVFADEVLARRIPVGMRQNLDQFLVLCSIPKNIPYSLDFRDGH